MKVKILVIGPKETGKTYISNFLGDATENIAGSYKPTAAVRILEFENKLNVNNQSVKADIELWDTSGDHRYESCWPAIRQDVNGVIFVYDPANNAHSHELDVLFSYFVEQSGLKETNCFVFSNSPSGGSSYYNSSKLSSNFSRIPQVDIDLESAANRARSDFNNFLSTVMTHMCEKREMEELNIVNVRG